MNPKLTVDHLRRRAIVYIRQSTPDQVLHHQESTRRQYTLVDQAHSLGFEDVVVIDEDLGRTGSGLVERPGFQRLVAEVCSSEVGAVLCIEASRLARNGRDWHHLIELCGMVGAVVIDPDGVYDPNLTNDRLLLGLKGEMSAFELSLLRQRSLEARRQKAHRGELQFTVPVGFRWTTNGQIEKDPDQRVQQAIELVFRKMNELGSVRQVLIWFCRQHLCLPVLSRQAGEAGVVWKPPVYRHLWVMLTHPAYAGAYAYGRRDVRVAIVDGRARKSKGHLKPRSEWTVLIRDHHVGYISWEQYERHQVMIAANAHMKSDGEAKAGRGGRSLLCGLLRCRRCGHMLHTRYSCLGGAVVPRYECNDRHRYYGEARCIAFGGLWVDEAVGKEVLGAIGGNGVEAALEAAEQMRQQRQEVRRALELEAEEARWNVALQKVHDAEQRLEKFDLGAEGVVLPDKELLLSLAQDVPAIWNSPSTDLRLKQRIVRIVIEEIVADVDEEKREVVLLIHWAGGRHSELRVKKRKTGQHRWCTCLEAVEIVRQMAGRFTDELIAATLNRLELKTGVGNTWTKERVYSLRHHHHLPGFDPNRPQSEVSLEEAAQRLLVSPASVRRMINETILPARQVVPYAPWEIPLAALHSATVQHEVTRIKNRVRVPQTQIGEGQQTMFSGT
jgi:DNA invertase Pin-like site-specific DNA recombinase